MTHSPGGRPFIPRVDVLQVSGLAELTSRDYYALVGYLVARGLGVEPVLEPLSVPQVVFSHIEGADSAQVAPAEAETSSVSLTLWDLERFTPATTSLPLSTKSIWNALQGSIDRIAQAKRYTKSGATVPSEEWENIDKLHFLASLDIARVEGVAGDPKGRLAVDIHSLHKALGVMLSKGYRFIIEQRPLPGLGAVGISFLAAYINERLKPEKLLPLYKNEKSLEPLPPRDRRIMRPHSDYVLRVGSKNDGGDGEIVVGRDQVHKYVMDWGGANGSTGRLLEIFQSLAERCITDGALESSEPGTWINDDVYYVRKHRAPQTGNEFDVWAIRLQKFIELIYDLESSADLRKQVRGYGLEFRKLVRLFLTDVAPYVSPIERPA